MIWSGYESDDYPEVRMEKSLIEDVLKSIERTFSITESISYKRENRLMKGVCIRLTTKNNIHNGIENMC